MRVRPPSAHRLRIQGFEEAGEKFTRPEDA